MEGKGFLSHQERSTNGFEEGHNHGRDLIGGEFVHYNHTWGSISNTPRTLYAGQAEVPEALRYCADPLVATGGKLPPVIHASEWLLLEQLVNKHDL